MRVALNGLFLNYPATGTGQYLRELVRAMREFGAEFDPVFLAPVADPSAPAEVQVHPTSLKSENPAKLEFEQVTFPQASRAGFDLAHIPHFGPPLFPTRPTIVTIHDLIPMVLPAYGHSLNVRLYNRLAGMGARRAQAILADSHASARDIHTKLGIAESKIHVVHLAADARYAPPTLQEILRVREKYGLPKRYVLYLGGFDVRKNVRRVVKAFATVTTATELRDWTLVLAGRLPEHDTNFFPDPRRLAGESGVSDRTRFIGFAAEEDKPALYAAATVFLYPSVYEGFGLPPLEAMASGTPVIVSNSSSLPAVVGDAGILLAPDDEQGWADALGQALTDERTRVEMRERGLEQARRFSWERAARETLVVYHSVV